MISVFKFWRIYETVCRNALWDRVILRLGKLLSKMATQQFIRAPEHDEEVLVATALLHALQGEYVERVEETGSSNIMTVMNTDGVQVWQQPGPGKIHVFHARSILRGSLVILACCQLSHKPDFKC